MYVKDKRLHKDELYFSAKDEEEIMNLFLNLSPLVEMQNQINMQEIANH